jgi:SAM-dependent methyltransferase
MDGAAAARIRAAVRAKYAEVARDPRERFPYAIGREGALGLGYEQACVDAIPPEIVDRFVGVGNVFETVRPGHGSRALDLGCGSGFDCCVAAILCGPEGEVIGADTSRAMLAHAAAARADPRFAGVSFVQAAVEELPFPDAGFDLAISNGVMNLIVDKDRAFREVRRVLRDGGRFSMMDLLVVETVPDHVLQDVDAWST